MSFVKDLKDELINFLREGQKKIVRFQKITECNKNGPQAEAHFTEAENVITETAIKCTRCNLPIAYDTTRVGPKDSDKVYHHMKNLIDRSTCPLLEI